MFGLSTAYPSATSHGTTEWDCGQLLRAAQTGPPWMLTTRGCGPGDAGVTSRPSMGVPSGADHWTHCTSPDTALAYSVPSFATAAKTAPPSSPTTSTRGGTA